MDINGVYEFLRRMSKTIAPVSASFALRDFNNSSLLILQEQADRIQRENKINEIAFKNAQLLSNIDSPLFRNTEMVEKALRIQWDAISALILSFQTPEIKSLSLAMANNQIEALSTFIKSIDKVTINAANMAFVKRAKIFECKDLVLPKGLPTIINEVNVGTAERLSQTKNIELNIPKKMFYIQSNPYNDINILETNVAFSSLDIFSNVTEEEIIDFINELENNYAFANTSYVGQKVNNIVANWKNIIDFDYKYFYHGRAWEDGQTSPYKPEKLLKAPSGYTLHGRYNSVGENHYYFSNESKGAVIEVRKHSSKKIIQVAKLKPKKSIKMVDFSENLTTRNKFLEYCRKDYVDDPEIKRHREYLFPCFVASCCKANNIDGIKYYGSKEYRNYVSWQDNYFDIVDSEIM